MAIRYLKEAYPVLELSWEQHEVTMQLVTMMAAAIPRKAIKGVCI